jgi:hypothetical protein
MPDSNVIYLGKWKREKFFKKTISKTCLLLDLVLANWTFYAIAFLGMSFIFFILALSMLMVFPLWITKFIFPEKEVERQLRPVVRLVKVEKSL